MQSQSYRDVLEKLYTARRLGIDFGLERVSNCLDALGCRTGSAKFVVQIAGTNGKGSTARFVENALQCAGYRVGVFSSPHLTSLCERFRVDGTQVEPQAVVRSYDAIEKYVEKLTFFEQITVLAAWMFKDAKVDVAIYEVGLGGRLDSTTAIEAQVGVVTGIGLDHQEFLGESLGEIALEKAGIFRSGGEAIIGLSMPEEVRGILSGAAVEVGARPHLVDMQDMEKVPLVMAMVGVHQQRNAAAAAAALEALQGMGLLIDPQAIATGLAMANMSGRMQELEAGLWVDGAHNPQAARALSEVWGAKGEKVVLIVGLSKPKAIGDFLRSLAPHCVALIATQADNERAYSTDAIAKEAKALGVTSVYSESSVSDAVALARQKYPGIDLLVTGSLLLIGNLLREMGERQSDPMVVSDPSRRPTP